MPTIKLHHRAISRSPGAIPGSQPVPGHTKTGADARESARRQKTTPRRVHNA
jgi:hypothetical protein